MNVYAQCRRLHALGMEERAKGGYEHGSIPFTLLPYRPDGTPMKPIVLPGGLDDEQRAKLHVIPAIFSLLKVSAVMIQSDTMVVESPEFKKHFGLDPTLSMEAYMEAYSRILNEKFEGTMANLPRHLWSDVLFTGVKGPRIKPLMLSSNFRPDTDGRVIYEPVFETDSFIWNIVPDWWEPTVQ